MQNIEQMPIAGRERVCCYITRGRELLVFEHDQEYDDGAVGIQVVGGGVDEGETLERAAIRETFEESGLVLERAVFLGTSRRESTLEQWKGHQQVRHYFWLEAPPQTPDKWSHTVSSGELDEGMVFHHRFVALEDVELVFEMGEMLERLNEAMKNKDLLGEGFVLKVKDLFEKGSFGGIVLGDSIATVTAILGQSDRFEHIEWSREKCFSYGTLKMYFSEYGLEKIIIRTIKQRCLMPLFKFDSWSLDSTMQIEEAIFTLKTLDIGTSVRIDEDNGYASLNFFGHKEFANIRPNPYHYLISFYWCNNEQTQSYLSIS